MSDRPPNRKRHHRPWRAALRALRRDTDAATAIEYGLVASLIVVAMLASLSGVANITTSMWNNISTKVVNAH